MVGNLSGNAINAIVQDLKEYKANGWILHDGPYWYGENIYQGIYKKIASADGMNPKYLGERGLVDGDEALLERLEDDHEYWFSVQKEVHESLGINAEIDIDLINEVEVSLS
jgi:hypothetical protein